MQFLERLLGFSLLLAGALMTSGCSDRAQMPLVSGSVTLDGAPIAEGKIRFEPTDGRGPTAEAMIVDGKYEVRIPLGKEKVLIEAYKPGNPPARPDTYPGLQAGLPKVQFLPARYNSRTELTAEIGPDNQPLDFELQSQ